MSDTNGSAATLPELEQELSRLELEEKVEKARLRLAQLARQRKLAELSAQHAWPRQPNPGGRLLAEHLGQRRDKQRELVEAKAAGKELQETSFLWDWVSGSQDLIDRLRSPDGLLLSAISVAADKKYGCYWPFFRTWNDLALLRGASRILYQTSALAQGAIEGLKSYIIGQGSQTRAVEKDGCPPGLRTAVQECLDEYSDRNQWPTLEQELLARDVVDGEWLLREFAQDDGSVLVRTVDPPQLLQPGNGSLEEWSFGIKNPVNPTDVQTALAFWVAYDGDTSKGEEVSIDEAHWHKSNTPRDVKRGLPDLCYDVYDYLKVAGRLIVNMAEGSAIQAAVAEIRQWEGPVTGDLASAFVGNEADYTETNPWTGATQQVRQVRPGERLEIPKGMTFIPPPFTQGSPIFIQVEQAVLRAVAVRWNAPEWLTSGDASNNNYASSLTAESPFIKRCVRRQAEYECHFTAARWRALKHLCEATGGITVNGVKWDFDQVRKYIDIQVELPSPEVRDRAEEAQANSVRIQGGWKSRQTVAQEEGLDWEEERRNIEEYNETMGGGQGLQLPGQDGQMPPGMGGMGGGSPFEEQRLLESGFTGIDSHGHKWVNGKQVARGDDGSGADQGGEGGRLAQDLASLPATAEGMQRLIYVQPTDQDDMADLREVDGKALDKLGVKVLAATPDGAHVMQLPAGADWKETSKALRRRFGDLGVSPLLKSEPNQLWDHLGTPAETLYSFDGKFATKPLSKDWALLAGEAGDNPRIVPAAKVERMRKASARYKPEVAEQLQGEDTTEDDDPADDSGPPAESDTSIPEGEGEQTASEESPQTFADLAADILYGIYGEQALQLLQGGDEHVSEQVLLEAWDASHHPRGKNGRFIPKGSAEAVGAAKESISKALKGEHTPASAAEVMGHLNLLTVKQLQQIHKEHGKKAPGRLRAQLVDSIKGHLDELHQAKGHKPAAKPKAPKQPATEPAREPAKAEPTAAPTQEPKREPPTAPADVAKQAEEADSAIGRAFRTKGTYSANDNEADIDILARQLGRAIPDLTEKEFKQLMLQAQAQRAVELHAVNEQGRASPEFRRMQIVNPKAAAGKLDLRGLVILKDKGKMSEVVRDFLANRQDSKAAHAQHKILPVPGTENPSPSGQK